MTPAPDTFELRSPQKPRMPLRRSFASGRAIFALILREMATSYGRSPGGYIWAIAEPVMGIAFLTIVFSFMFNLPPIGNSFAMFYATGMMPFLLFSELQSKVMHALLHSKPLLAYPTVTFLDALLARAILCMLTNILNAYLVFGGAILFFEGPMRIDFLTVAHGIFLAGLLGLGVGTLNCYILMKLPIWQQAWSLLMRPMFVLSGVMMLFASIPQSFQNILWWNPLIHIIGEVRRGFYENYDGSYISTLYVVLVSLICFLLGLLLLRANYRDLLEGN